MEEELVFLLLLGLILFFVWNSNKKPAAMVTSSSTGIQHNYPTESTGKAVPLDVIQAVIEKFQTTQEDMVPIETLYFTPLSDGLYKARLMFLNTRHFIGQQFDIQASIDDSGKVTILDTESTTDPVNYNDAYVPDTYGSFDVLSASIDNQLQSALSETRSNSWPIQLTQYFSSSFDKNLTKLDLQTRASSEIENMGY